MNKVEFDQAVQKLVSEGGRVVEAGNGYVKVTGIHRPTHGEVVTGWTFVSTALLVSMLGFIMPLLLLVSVPAGVYLMFRGFRTMSSQPYTTVIREDYQSWYNRTQRPML